MIGALKQPLPHVRVQQSKEIDPKESKKFVENDLQQYTCFKEQFLSLQRRCICLLLKH